MRILRWGIYVVVFCLPLYLVRFKVFGIPTTILELMIYFLFIGWLIKELKIKNHESWVGRLRKFVIHNSSFIIPVCLILVGVSLATVFSLDLRTSAGIWKAWFVDPILFFVVLFGVIKNSEQVKRVLLSLFFSGTIVSIISLIYVLQGRLDPVGRLQGFYDSPNYLAMYLAPCLIMGVGYYIFTFLGRPSEAASGTSPSLAPLSGAPCPLGLVTRKNIISNTLVSFAIIGLAFSIFFTKSYGAWVGIMAAVGFVLILNCFRLKKIQLAVLLSCLFLLAGLFLGCFALSVRTESLSARLAIWQQAREVFKVHSILGIGPGTFDHYFSLYPEWNVPQPHNIFLAFLLQTGIIGFIGLIGLLIWFFKAGIKLLNVNCYALIVMCIMVYILVHGLVDTTYWKNDLAVIFWLVVGLMVVIGSQSFVPIVKKS